MGKNLSFKFWAEAINTSIYLKNRSPCSAIKGRTPEEAWTGYKPSVKHLRIFGSRASVLVPKERRRSKVESKSWMGIFVGYSIQSKAYRIWDPMKRRTIISRDVIVEEETSTQPKESLELKLMPEEKGGNDDEI